MNRDKIKLIVYDFDGVMTDNKVLVDDMGHESVVVHRGDGYAVSQIKKFGIPQIILSTEPNPVVMRRAEKLHIPAIHGVDDKKTILKKYCAENGIDLADVLYVGNDLNDYDTMISVGYPCCPADAECEIKEISCWVSSVCGGNGVIRELYRVLQNGD